jgi:ABC-type lipoprotein export system ATPase subunit
MIQVEGLKKSFGEPPVEVLRGLDFTIPSGSFASITGKSGSGKSTLLYVMSTLDKPSAGKVFFNGVDLAQLSSREVHAFRNQKMGFVFQFHYLLPEISALENILMPARKLNQHLSRRGRAEELMRIFDLQGKENRLPKQLSGGEQQRVAIARALIMNPEILFADEPTGNLDTSNGDVVMKILKGITADMGATVVYVTHDPDYAAQAALRLHLIDGRLS